MRDGEIELAKNMVELFLYEIDRYGTILNANRSYFLQRSQPPFLTQMVMALFEQIQDKDWLRSIIPTIEHYYYYWLVPPHLKRLLAEVREQGTGNREQKEELRLKASKAICF